MHQLRWHHLGYMQHLITQFFNGQTLFLTSNQQRQSTEGMSTIMRRDNNCLMLLSAITSNDQNPHTSNLHSKLQCNTANNWTENACTAMNLWTQQTGF